MGKNEPGEPGDIEVVDHLIIPLESRFSYLEQVKEKERQEKQREIERMRRALWRFDNCYVGSDGAFWDMVCAVALGLEVR